MIVFLHSFVCTDSPHQQRKCYVFDTVVMETRKQTSPCCMNDALSCYLIPQEGPTKSLQSPQPDYPECTTTPIQTTGTSEQSGMSQNRKGAERGITLLDKVAGSHRGEELPRSTSAEQQVQPPRATLTQHSKTDEAQTQQSVLKMQPASLAMPKAQPALATPKTEATTAEHLRRQRNEMKGNDADGRSQEAPLAATLKSLRLNRLEQDSKTAGKSTTRQTDPTRIKTNHRMYPNPKGPTQRKAGEPGNGNATVLKESKVSSKSSSSQMTSPGFCAEPFRSKAVHESPSTDLKVGKKYLSRPKRGLVLSKSAFADLSSPLMHSPRMNSAKTSPGSAPATSSLKTKTTFGLTMGGGSTPEAQEAPTAIPKEVKSSAVTSNLLSRGLTFDAGTKSPVEAVLFQEDVGKTGTRGSPGKAENKKPEIGRRKDVGNLSPNPLTACSLQSGRSRTVRDSASMTDISERFREQRDVGTQVDFHCSVLQKVTDASSLTSPDHQSNILTCVNKPSFHHVCKIDIELCSRTVLSSGARDDATSLPTCLRTASFQQKCERSLGTQRIEEVERNGGDPTQQETEIADKPQEVVWDKEGMTWEVYGASVDLDCLGVAIQAHLESKIKEQQKHISSLRRSICSNSNTKACKVKMKRRVGVFTCCGKASVVKD